MNRSKFLAAFLAIVVSPWNAFFAKTRKPYKPLLRQVFPTNLEQLPGLWCKWIHDTNPWPYEIIREYDEYMDTWQGEHLYNPRRNKWWAKDVNGKTVLIVTGYKFNDPETLFFEKV